MGSKPITEFIPNLLDQLRNLLLKQEWYRDYATAEGRKTLSFVGRFNVNSSYEKVAADIANELGINSQFRAAASNWEGFLTNFMANAEAAGILVIRSGVVASASQRPLSVKEFRGFVLSGPIAPLVFINGADSTSAQVFTLAHEMVHQSIQQQHRADQICRYPLHHEFSLNRVAAAPDRADRLTVQCGPMVALSIQAPQPLNKATCMPQPALVLNRIE